MKRILTLWFFLGVLFVAQAQKPQMHCVYMFGFASSLVDSLAFQTDIQMIDSVYIHKNGLLAGRMQYSSQLQQALQRETGNANITCAIFFDTKKSRLEKRYLKLKRRYIKSHSVVVRHFGTDSFRFHAEPFIDEEKIIEEKK